MINRIKHLYEFRRNISFIGLFNAFRFFIRIDKIPQIDILYACHDNSRPILLNGKYYSPLIDSLIEKLNRYEHATLALPFSKYSGNKVAGNTINLNLYVIIALIKRFLTSGAIIFKNKKNDPLVEFYYRLYKALNVKIIIAIQPSVEMCIAAKKYKIKILDVQHGIIESEDPESYYSLNKRSLYQNSGWPDYILCRNMQSYKSILKLKDNTKPVLIGNLNKFFYKNIYTNVNDSEIFKTKEKIILFTFQPFYTCSNFSENNMNEGIIFPNALLELIKNSNYNFILKLHPAQIHNDDTFTFYNKALKKLFLGYNNVDFTICNKKPLEFSLSKSNLHITFNSASLYDAIDYDLKTILLDDNLARLKNYFGELIDTNYVAVDSKLNTDFNKYFDRIEENEEKDFLNSFNFEKFILSNTR